MNALGTGNVNILNGSNSGIAILEVGAQLGFGIGSTSTWDLRAAIGTGAGQIQFPGANGFSNPGFSAWVANPTSSSVRAVELTPNGGPTGIINVVGQVIQSKATGQVPNGGGDGWAFGSPTANAMLILQNGIDFEGTAANRNIRTIRGVGNVPEAMLMGQIRNGNSANFLNYDGTGGVVINNMRFIGGSGANAPTGIYANFAAPAVVAGNGAVGTDAGTVTATTALVFYSGGMYVADNDAAAAGVSSPLGNNAATMQVGNNTSANNATPLGSINTGLMTFGQNGTAGGLGTSASPAITIARNITFGTGGTGQLSLGGFTPDFSKFTGGITLSANASADAVHFAQASGGQTEFSGVIGGTGGLNVGGAIIEGTTLTNGINVSGGTVKISGNANTYTGATVVRGGTLLYNSTTTPTTTNGPLGPIAASGNTNVLTIASSNTQFAAGNLSGTGTVGYATTIQNGATLSPQATSGTSYSTLSFSNGLTLNTGANLNFNIGSSTAAGNFDAFAVTGGSFAPSGTINLALTFQSTVIPGTYKVGTYSGAPSATANIFSNNGTSTFNYSAAFNSGELDVLVTPKTSTDTWTGTADGTTWDNAAANWTTTASTNVFTNGDTVIFPDPASLSGSPALTTVAVAGGGVLPISTTVHTSTGHDYSIGGGSIGDAVVSSVTVPGTLTKDGAGVLTLTSANAYSAGTTVTNGTLTGQAVGAFGSGSLTIAPAGNTAAGSVTVNSNDSIGHSAAVTMTPNGLATATLIMNATAPQIGTLAGSGSVVLNNVAGTNLTLGNSNTSSFAGTIANGAGTGSLTKTGSGTQTLSGVLSYTGTTTVGGTGGADTDQYRQHHRWHRKRGHRRNADCRRSHVAGHHQPFHRNVRRCPAGRYAFPAFRQ